MHVIPNTTVSIYRGTAIDEYDGSITNETVQSSGNSASITEQTRRIFDPTSGAPRLIRFITGRLEAGTDVTRRDRLLDEVKEVWYWVRFVRQHSNPLYTSEMILDLARVDNEEP